MCSEERNLRNLEVGDDRLIASRTCAATTRLSEHNRRNGRDEI